MVGKGVYLKLAVFLSVLIFVLLILMSFVWQNTGFVPEMVIFIVLAFFLYFTYRHWNLNLPVYAILMLSFIPHCLGFMGFYLNSPLPIAWDHFTHVLPCFAFSLFFFLF